MWCTDVSLQCSGDIGEDDKGCEPFLVLFDCLKTPFAGILAYELFFPTGNLMGVTQGSPCGS